MQTINTLSIETPRGFREFELVQGDLADHPASLLIFSVNAGMAPTGQVLRALVKRHGPLDLEQCGLVLSFAGYSPFRLSDPPGHFESLAGVYQVPRPRSFAPGRGLLMVRVPGAASFPSQDESIAAYARVVRGTFAAVAALELGGSHHDSIALSQLGGRRHFPKEDAIRHLLNAALGWLGMARHTEKISFVVYDPADVREWTQAMDCALGRTFDDGQYASALLELRTSMLEQIGKVLAWEQGHALKTVLGDIAAALEHEQGLSIQQFGVLGRLLAEAVTGRLCSDLGLKPGQNTFGNLEALAKTPFVSKWIHSYLHSLRILGNESVHLTNTPEGLPGRLASGDLVVILGNMLRVIDFYRLWRTQPPAGWSGPT